MSSAAGGTTSAGASWLVAAVPAWFPSSTAPLPISSSRYQPTAVRNYDADGVVPPPGYVVETFDDKKMTGVYVPLGTKTDPGYTVKGQEICNGAFFRCNPGGSDLERIAEGFRSSFGYRFAPDGRLICTQNSANPLPPRGLWYDYESIYEVVDGEWYGWPDFGVISLRKMGMKAHAHTGVIWRVSREPAHTARRR